MTEEEGFPEWENPSTVSSLAAETEQGVTELEVFPARLERYHKARQRGLRMSKYTADMGDAKAARLLQACGSYLVFRQYYTVDRVRLHAASFCKKHLLCQLCAIRRGAKMVKRYHERVQAVRELKPDLRPYLVTVTVKDGSELLERFNHLTGAMRRYQEQRRNYLKGRGPHVEMAKACGVVGSYEFKRGSGSGLWHPHCHMVWLCSTPPDAAKLSREWQHLTGDSFIVDSRPIEGDGVEGFLEVFKYAVKFSDLPIEDNFEAAMTLQRRRLVFALGDLYGIPEVEDLADDPLALDDLPYLELFYRHTPGGYSLVPEKSQLDPQAGEPDPLEGLGFDEAKRAAFEQWNIQRLAAAEASEADHRRREALQMVERLQEAELWERWRMSDQERWVEHDRAMFGNALPEEAQAWS